MSFRFDRHYTVAQAQALLPRVQQTLARLRELRKAINGFNSQVTRQFPLGFDLGGPALHRHIRRQLEWEDILRNLDDQCIIVRDLDRGLVDFPSLREGREVFLCWEEGEPQIAYWHDLDAGYAGRQPL
ncbi:MAG: DUF2203 domain-containing protein [Limisphaera sp.]|nr:DUF2203 domain-containing protein [Limisphaera sp.]